MNEPLRRDLASPSQVNPIRGASPWKLFSKERFFESVGYEPHAGQVAVHRSTAPRRVLACGVRWGKSMCAAAEGLAAAMRPSDRSVGWVVAPTYDLSNKVFREIVIMAGETLRHRIVKLSEHEMRLVLRNLGGGLSEIRGKSADNPVSLLGEGLDWLIVDEAARLKADVWTSHLTQRLLDKEGWALLISTPRGKGWFFDAWRRGQGLDADYESWNAPSWENPHLVKDAIEAERERLPAGVFNQEYGGQFIEGAGSVFRMVREAATGRIEEPVKGAIYFAGVDLAKVEDFTVLVIADVSGKVVFVDRFHRLDWSLQVARIKAATERYNFARVLVDSTGVGEPVLEAMRREGIRAEAYTLTNKSKAALIDNLALRLEKRELVLPSAEVCPELIEELEGFEYSVTESGNVKTGAAGGLHDDCVIALGLAVWKARRARPEIQFL